MSETRCVWAKEGTLDGQYHDTVWGVPKHDDRTLFEFLILEGAQAGLSWSTVLKKQQCYKQAFDDFDPAAVAAYNETKVQALLQNEGIIRNKLKIHSAIRNAKVFVEIQHEFGTFDNYLWRFTGGKTIFHPSVNEWDETHVTTPESDAMSVDLKARGFKFVGSTICYAYMQSIGMVNDHLASCHKHKGQ